MIYELIQTLPFDIKLKIRNIVYVLNYQPKKLLDDILDFGESKLSIINKYYTTWVIQLEEHPPEHMFWLIGDIYNFFNYGSYIYYMSTNIRMKRSLISLKLNEILNRNYTYINIKTLGQKNIYSEFNILWGLLTPTERNNVKKLYC